MAKQKSQILGRLSANLAKFGAAYLGSFLCPTCLRQVPLTSKSEISEAHIVPKYSGGSLKTYLCRKCNSDFGKNQDLWFGEYLYLASSEKGLLATRKQRHTFTMNGVEVAGEVKELDDGTVEFYVYKNLMSPESLSALEAAETPGRVEISVHLPIVVETQSIMVGFLTAAYLLWFKELGYSWVFQAHMNRVRTQILNPRKRILTPNCVIDAGDQYFERPWIGFLEVNSDSYPCAGIADRIVVFPSFSSAGSYEQLDKHRGKTITTEYEAVRISDYHHVPDPMGIVYRHQMMVFPDHFCNGSITPRVFMYLGDGQPPKELHLMDDKVGLGDGRETDVQVIKIR